jgi:repressor LexA
MAYGLTRRQAELLRYVAGYQEAKGAIPSPTEMRDALGLRSRSGLYRLLPALAERGFVGCITSPTDIEVLESIAIPRAPDGAPLYAVPGFGGEG